MTNYTGTYQDPLSLYFGYPYSYNWIPVNYEGLMPPTLFLSPFSQQGNAIYFDFSVPDELRTKMVYDGTNWVLPGYAWDEELGQWVKYDKVFDGESWV